MVDEVADLLDASSLITPTNKKAYDQLVEDFKMM